MNCPTLYKKIENGFTLVELIVVVAIFLMLMGVSELAFYNFQSHNNLELATNNLVEAVRHAKVNAEQIQGDSKWGVAIVQNNIVVFAGASYLTRNTALDQTIPFPSGVSASGLSEIVFDKATGATSNSGSITLSSNYGNKVITINAKGTITY